MTQQYPKADQFMANTHEVEHQPQPLENYNLYLADTALQSAVERDIVIQTLRTTLLYVSGYALIGYEY